MEEGGKEASNSAGFMEEHKKGRDMYMYLRKNQEVRCKIKGRGESSKLCISGHQMTRRDVICRGAGRGRGRNGLPPYCRCRIRCN